LIDHRRCAFISREQRSFDQQTHCFRQEKRQAQRGSGRQHQKDRGFYQVNRCSFKASETSRAEEAIDING
jgi:hypothetical protein